MKNILINLSIIFFLCLNISNAQSDPMQKMAEQMAKWIDQVWDVVPTDGTANIRFLLLQDEKPMQGKVSIEGEFNFKAVGRSINTQAFNPNENGRWVYENIVPGKYKIIIEGKGKYESFKWEKDNVELKADTNPKFEINVPLATEG